MERYGWHACVRIDKFRAADVEEAERSGIVLANLGTLQEAGLDPFDFTEAEHNLMVNGGITSMLTLLIGGGGTTYANGNARLCAGDGAGSVPTAAATDTDLAASTGSTHRYMQAANSTYPSVSGEVLTIVGTFASGNGNFVWNEWGIDYGGSSGTGAASGLLNHKGVNLGTKTSAAAWQFTATITES
jgi:hypothetical protein